MSGAERIPVLYLAPWVGFGGSDRNTIDWFRWIDRERFAPSLVTTQSSANELIGEIEPFAEEVWVLPDLMPAEKMPGFILDFVQSRGIRVVHLMNSRIGFDLIPDLTCVDNPPAIVVQLHVEEEDRSGYVRYVTTRYGNLVDRFSISNQHVADAVAGYGIPADRIEVIYTGVDAEQEFAPERVKPVAEFPEERLDVLFAARLVPQKDPLLMVDVASELRAREVDFRIHVVGDGELKEQVEARVASAGVADRVDFHPPTPGLHDWYAATDAMLMTSTFEGVPCVVFEAMAMGLPVVAPGLPGIREMLDSESDGLIEQRDSATAYAERLARLASDREHRDAVGTQLRERARGRFSVQEMAERHGEIYEQVAPPAPPREQLPPLFSDPIRFPDRPPAESEPLVSVIVPHYNQTRFLGECIDSIRAQSYGRIEVIVVDDASDAADAGAALDRLEAAAGVTVVRQRENRGPSHARNLGVERCSGSYVLPVDADNKLMPGAIAALVAQLSAAGEEVGFVYPNLQFFGNRDDYYEVPEFNLYTLLHGNFCDTCSLLDRRIFDAGIRYAEQIKLGHEDWEFVLRLAARGVRGQAAQEPTLLYRKWGFNRSDLVDHSPDDFRDDVLAEISPFRGREAEVKALEAPALSLIALGLPDEDAAAALEAGVASQRCSDFELVPAAEGEDLAPVRDGLERAKGAFAALTLGDGSELLRDPGFIARLLRRFDAAEDDLDGIALVDAGADGRYPLRALAPDELPAASPHTVVWRRRVEGMLPRGLHARAGDPVGTVVQALCEGGAPVEWRHSPGPRAGSSPSERDEWVPLPEDPENERDPEGLRPAAQPLLPGIGTYRVPRWEQVPTWIAPLSTIAIRYRERDGERRIVTNGGAPPGFDPEQHLGALRSTALEGTVRIVRDGEDYLALPRDASGACPRDAVEIGYAEQAGLPGMAGLALARHLATGQRTLVVTPFDPLIPEVELLDHLGFIDPFPLHPIDTPFAERGPGLVGLTKTADVDARRHRYAIGAVPDGTLLGELGALALSDRGGSVGAWIVDGYLVTERYRPPAAAGGAVERVRWSAEPLAWRGTVPVGTWGRVVARRALTSARRGGGAPLPEPIGEPEAWLFDLRRPGMAPLFASHHPVTGDQLLTRSREDAAQMGYSDPQLLGYVRLLAPLTGDLSHRPHSVPWARRFGAVPQTG